MWYTLGSCDTTCHLARSTPPVPAPAVEHASADAPWPISPSTLPTSARAGAQNALSASVVTTPVRRMPWPTATKQDAKGNGVEHKNAAFHLICVIMR